MSVVRVFTPEAITLISEMKAAGAKGAEIAKAIGTTPGSLRARCCQLKRKQQSRSEAAAV